MRLRTKQAYPRRNGHAARNGNGSAPTAADRASGTEREVAQLGLVAIAVYQRELWSIVEAKPLAWQLGAVGRNGSRAIPATERLRAAILQMQWAVVVEQTEGAPPPRQEAWQTLVELAEPVIRKAVVAAGVTGADVDDCVQDTWLKVVRAVETLHPASSGLGLTSWLRTLARRTAVDFHRRQVNTLAECPLMHDHQPCMALESADPACICIERESLRQLARSVHTLRDQAGEWTHQVVTRYLAGKTNLTALAKELRISRGRLFHAWRTALRRLHDDLA